MKETWKDIKGHEGVYQVSSIGRVKRLQSGILVRDSKQHRTYYKKINEKIITQFIDSSGYETVNIKGKRYSRTRVHRLVAETFLPIPDGAQCVNHKDGNKHNNQLSNLEWCTFKQNVAHAVKSGLIDINKLPRNYTPVNMLTLNGEYVASFGSITEALEYLGKAKYRGSITEVCQGKRNKALGYKWEYSDENKA